MYLGDHLGRSGYCPSRLSADLPPPYGMSLSGGWVGHALGVPVRASALPRTALRRALPTALTRRCAPPACAPAAAVAFWPAPWCSPRTAKAVRCRLPRPVGTRRPQVAPAAAVALAGTVVLAAHSCGCASFRPAPSCSPRTAMAVRPCCRALAGTEVLAAHCWGCVLSSAAVYGRELAVHFDRRALAAVALLAPCVITLTARHQSRLAARSLPSL